VVPDRPGPAIAIFTFECFSLIGLKLDRIRCLMVGLKVFNHITPSSNLALHPTKSTIVHLAKDHLGFVAAFRPFIDSSRTLNGYVRHHDQLFFILRMRSCNSLARVERIDTQDGGNGLEFRFKINKWLTTKLL